MTTNTHNQTAAHEPESAQNREGETFLYIRVEIARPDPVSTGVFNIMAGMIGAKPKSEADDLHPGCIGFQHVQLVAKDEDEAYSIGHGLMPALEPDIITFNDCVIRL